MREGLKAHIIGDFADPEMRIEQKRLRFFHANPAQIIGEGQARRFLEHLAEIKGAHVHRLSNFVEIDGVSLIG